jgi:transcription initiation factor TFIID subunit 5
VRFEDGYCELRAWVDGSLDLYKAELHSVLYPLLIHCFLEVIRREYPDEARHFLARCSEEFVEDAVATASFDAPGRREELASLAGISSKLHLEQNETAQLFLNNRYELHLTSYAFELLIAFLSDDPRRAVLLRILNQRCRVLLNIDANKAARTGLPVLAPNEAASGGFVPDRETASCIQNHEVLWGRLTPDLYMIPDDHTADGQPTKAAKGAAAAEKATTAAAASVPVDKKGVDAAKDNAVVEEIEELQMPPHVHTDGTLSESRVPLKRYQLGALGLETEEDIRSRAKLGVSILNASGAQPTFENGQEQPSALNIDAVSASLPSVLCYTFTNTRSDGLNCSALSPDGSQVAGGFGDSTLRIWDAKASGTASRGSGGFGNQAHRLVGHSGPVYSVDWTSCGRFVLSGSEDGTVRLWSTVTQTDLVAYRGHNYPVWSVGFSPLGHYFASGSHDRSARIWVTDRTYPLRILAGHLADVDTVRWHPNCNYLATGSSDRTARLWDLRDGRCVRVFGSQTGAILSLAFSPDGRSLAVSGEGRDIEVWDIATGKQVTKLQGHTDTVWSMNFSREGTLLASGSADGTVRLWNTVNWSTGISGITDIAARANGVPADTTTAQTNATHGKRGRNFGVLSGRTSALLATLRTKQTPVHLVHFTRRNLLIAAGSFSPT